MKVLDVTTYMSDKNNNGGQVVHRRNFNMLKNIFGNDNVDLLELPRPNFITRLNNIIFTQSYGQTLLIKRKFKQLLKNNNYEFIFFDSSLFGSFVKLSKKNDIPSIVFYHNIEINYYQDMFKQKKNLLSFVFYNYIKRLEKKTIKHSDYNVVLNDRDKKELYRIYNKKASLLLPISMPARKLREQKYEGTKYCLFLGNNFFANQEGCSWFIENVVPYISTEVHFAGTICEYLYNKYGSLSKIVYDGYVEDLDEAYKNAAFIVSPIFHGSGMKTKTVEALSFGKTIFGTEEAFVGIDGDLNRIGALCNTAKEFIQSINSFQGENFNSYSYNIFKELYTDDIINKHFSNFIEKTIAPF